MKIYEIKPASVKKWHPDIDLRDKELKKLPADLPKICAGNFYVAGNKLTSLKGSPQEIASGFYCGRNILTSLHGGPKKVKGSFGCSTGNMLDDLEGGPVFVGGNYRCNFVGLKSLKGAPKDFGGEFECSSNLLYDLHDIHKHLPRMNGVLTFYRNPIESHVLGILKIQGCKRVEMDNKEVQKIINKYLPLGDLLDCQEELIEAGFEDFAQL